MALNKIKTSSLDDDSVTSAKLANGAVTADDINDGELPLAKISQVNLDIAPEVLEIQVAAPAAGQDTAWLWTWLTSSLPYARREITNSPEIQVPLYRQGTYTVNNYAAYDLFDQMTQTHSLYLKWIDGAGTDNLVSWATSTGPVSDTHPDINSGNATDVQRINISVPATITLPTLTAPNVSYTVVNNGAGAYTFSGAAKGDNPNIGPFYRGGTYTFNITATGHPLYLTTDNGTNFASGTYFGEYTDGVTGSRTDSGTLTIVVPNDAPDTLYYQCGNHGVMRGAITVKDLAVETNINGNPVVYFQHTQEGHKTPVEIRPIPALVNQMCLVYDAGTGKFVPQDLATYVENTPSFENKIREVAGTAELVVEDGSAVIAKVNVYDDSTYLPLTGNNAGDQAFATDTDILYIWDGSAWQQAGASNSDDLTEGTTNLFYTDARADARAQLKIDALVDTAPATLDTLNELAAALGDDPNFATTVTNNIATKLPLAGGTLTGDLIMDASTKLSVGNPSPLSKLQVGGDPITTAIPIVTISETTDGASLLLRGQSPTLIFDQTSGGHGRIIQDGVDLSFYDGDFDNPGNVIMTVGTDSVSFNKQPILPKVSSPNTPYEGGLYYDIDDNTAKFYDGSSWIPMGTTVNRYNYTATAGQTSFAASYTSGNVDVYLNGTKLTRVADYVDTSGTAVVLTTGADVGDLVDIVAFSAYSVADTVSASNGGSFSSPIGVQSQIEVRAGGGGGRYIRYIDTNGTPTKHNFELGVQRVDQAWSVTPSDTVGGTDFNSVALTVNRYGNVGIGHHNTTQAHKLVIREGGYLSGIMRIEASGNNEHFAFGLQGGEAALYAGHSGSGNTDFNIYTARGGAEWQTARFKYNSGLELIQPEIGNWTGLNLINGRNDASDIGSQGTFIDFTFRDSNTNAEPQVRIGAIVGEDSTDAGAQNLEGSGEFTIRTYTGTNSGEPYTTSTEYEGLRVTHDGIARMPNVPAFDMVRTDDINAPFTYSNITGYNTLYFDNTPSVNSGGASLTNGSFTAPVDGIYHFYTWICYQNGEGGDDSHGIGFTVNGATYPGSWFRINPRFITRAGIEHVYTFQQNYQLSAGDYVQVGTSDFDNNGQIMEIRFGGHLVG